MTLSEYLSKNEKRPSVFAVEIGVSPSTITRALAGERRIGLEVAAKIEKHTKGQVPMRSWLSTPEAEQVTP